MITCYDIIQTMIRTEKSVGLEPQSKYVFAVALNATKVDIRRAVEEIYQVKVDHVRTMIMAPKRKRVRREFGHTAQWKKAVVTLVPGHKIEVS